MDDILRCLDPLPSFQLMSCLSAWAKRKNRLISMRLIWKVNKYSFSFRIVLVSMRTPRSDIYQLLNRLTILYYGEIFYSGRRQCFDVYLTRDQKLFHLTESNLGYTKKLPAYFKHAGFTCPSNENPAVYYCEFHSLLKTSERNGVIVPRNDCDTT